MIALCLQHHKEADSGAFTVEQLRQMKMIGTQGIVSGRFHWRRENTVFVAGGNVFADCPVILAIDDRPVLWLSKSPEGNDLFNIDLHGRTGRVAFQMRDNEWLAIPDLDDVKCPPNARSLALRSKHLDIALGLEFGDWSFADFSQRLSAERAEGLFLNLGVAQESMMLVCVVTGKFQSAVTLKRTKLEQPGGGRIEGSVFTHCGGGINIGTRLAS